MSSESGKTAAYREAMTAIYKSARVSSRSLGCEQAIVGYGEQEVEGGIREETHGRNEDKQRFKNLYILSKQIQTQINKDEILG